MMDGPTGGQMEKIMLLSYNLTMLGSHVASLVNPPSSLGGNSVINR